MSTLSDSGERYPWIRRVATPLAHWHPGVLVAYLAVLIAADVTHLAGTTRALVMLPALLVLDAAVAASFWHGLRLCTRCAANVPLDGSVEAQRDRWMLRCVHLGWKVRVAVYGALTLVGAFVEPVNYVALAMLAVDWVTILRHAVLQFWCPWCRGRDGDDEAVSDPDPVPSGQRPVGVTT